MTILLDLTTASKRSLDKHLSCCSGWSFGEQRVGHGRVPKTRPLAVVRGLGSEDELPESVTVRT
jgi:hypothetical protein